VSDSSNSTPNTPNVPSAPDLADLADPAGRDLLLRASKGLGAKIDVEAEIRAAQIAVATGVPMKVGNVAERIQAAIDSGAVTQEEVRALILRLTPAAAAPAPAPAPAVAAAPAHAVAAPAVAAPVAPVPEVAPPTQEQLAEAARRQIREMCARLNTQFGRPQGLEAPAEHRARRISLPLGEAELAGGMAHTFEGVVPLFQNEVPFAELRKLQILPFGADRCVLSALTLDDVEMTRGGPTPGTMLTRSDGAPTALVYPGCVVRATFTNVSPGPIRLSPSAQIVPLERDRSRTNGG
jgi:hypothetical protein